MSTALLFGGCTYSDPLSDVRCATHSDCPDGTHCEKGFCIFDTDADNSDASVPDTDTQHDDASLPDTSDTSDATPDADPPDADLCSPPQLFCQNRCIDPMAHPDHCGDCEQPCDNGELCQQGQCIDSLCNPLGEPFGNGSGSRDDPYRICSADQLRRIGTSGTQYLNSHFVLTEDIDLGQTSFEAIGTGTNNADESFAAVFDGGGFTISNLTIDEPDRNWVGLFRAIGPTGIVRNLKLQNVDITGDEVVGALVGGLFGHLINVHTHGKIVGSQRLGGLAGATGGQNSKIIASQAHVDIDGDSFIGGLVGRNNGIIEGSTAHGSITASGRSVGGLVGTHWPGPPGAAAANCLIVDSTTTSQIESVGSSNLQDIGGLVGQMPTAGCMIDQSRATGTILAENASRVGGLVGYLGPFTSIANSTSQSNVNGYNFVGGLVGFAGHADISQWNHDSSVIRDSHARGAISGNDYVGGLVGQMQGTVLRTSATGSVDGKKYVGGLVGYLTATADFASKIDQSYASAPTDGLEYIGGLVGYHQGELRDTYATGPTSGQESVGGLVGLLWHDTAPFAGEGKIFSSYSTGLVVGANLTGGLVGLSTLATPPPPAVADSYWNIDTSGQSESRGGSPLTSDEFADPNNFSAWNTQFWDLSANQDRPLLFWQQ